MNITNEGGTIIIKNSNDLSLPTLDVIFNNNKVEAIKGKMKKEKQKEKRRGIFSFGKNIAKLLRNKNYTIILLDKEKSELIEIGKNRNIDSKRLNSDHLNQSKNFLDNIPEVSTDDEYSFNRYDNNDLSKEEVISFTLKSLYKNINLHTNLKYIQNKTYEEKALKYLTKLIENKTRMSSNADNSGFSSPSQSGIFSKSLSINSSKNSINSGNKEMKNHPIHKDKILSYQKLDDILKLSNNDSQENIIFKSERFFEGKGHKLKHNKTKNTEKHLFSIGSSKISRVFTNLNNNLKKESNLNILDNLDFNRKQETKQSKKHKRKSLKDKTKFTFKLEDYDSIINNEKNSVKTK
jgi:hypothetical protein